MEELEFQNGMFTLYECKKRKQKVVIPYGLKTLKHQWCFLTKKSPLCNKRKARDIWATHKVTRNAHQVYTLSSFVFTQKIRFVRPNGDFTVIQTSHSHKKRNRDKLQSQAVCNKRSPHSYLTTVRRDWLFRRWWKKRCFDSGRFSYAKRVLRERWGVLVI